MFVGDDLTTDFYEVPKIIIKNNKVNSLVCELTITLALATLG